MNQITIEGFPRSIQRDFQPRPDLVRPCYRCFPRSTEEAGEFVDHLLNKVWDEPHITAARSCLNVPLLDQGDFKTEVRGLLKVRRNKRSPIIDFHMQYKTEYIVDLVVEDLEIDFVISRALRYIPWIQHGTASINFVRFTVDFSVYEEKITVDQVKFEGIEGLKIIDLNTGFLMKRYVRHRLVELLANNYENIAFTLEYNISNILNTVLRAFLKRAL